MQTPTWDCYLLLLTCLLPDLDSLPQLGCVFSLALVVLVMPSVIKGRGAVREYVWSYADMCADMAICYSAPFGSISQ